MNERALRTWFRAAIAAAAAPVVGGVAAIACDGDVIADGVADGAVSDTAAGDVSISTPVVDAGSDSSCTPGGAQFGWQARNCCTPDAPIFCCAYDGVLDAAPPLEEASVVVYGDAAPAWSMVLACDNFCAAEFSYCDVSEAGPPYAFSCGTDCTGRRATKLTSRPTIARFDQYLGAIAELEAESVVAFSSLGRSLRSMRAPRSLRRAIARARRDEIRHARMASALARREGATAKQPTVKATDHASLEALAVDNAVEGCVRETFGALVATYQAQHARDPHLRMMMQRIARDETRHAALAWTLAAWFERRLTRDGRMRVRRSMIAAASALEAATGTSEFEFADRAGLPSPSIGAQLASSLRSRMPVAE